MDYLNGLWNDTTTSWQMIEVAIGEMTTTQRTMFVITTVMLWTALDITAAVVRGTYEWIRYGYDDTNDPTKPQKQPWE